MNAIFFIIFLLFYSKSYALYIDTDVSSINQNMDFLSKVYINNTKKTNLYGVNVYKINSPGENETLELMKDREIIFTPLKKILLPNESEYFKFFYLGPKDDKERYYKIIISESPINIKYNSAPKNAVFHPIINIESYLIVRPRNTIFKYEFNSNLGVLKNAGNTYFRVLLHDNCNNDNTYPNVFYLLPGQEYKSERLKEKSRKYIIINDKYNLVDTCN